MTPVAGGSTTLRLILRAGISLILEVPGATGDYLADLTCRVSRGSIDHPLMSSSVRARKLTPGGKYQANVWQGTFPTANLGADGFSGRAPAGCFPANGYGLYDMTGNVWKWTASLYAAEGKSAMSDMPMDRMGAPAARVMRMDSDTTTRVGDHARILDAFESSGDVLVGTQMVAKGLDFPTVTLAAVVAADIGLHLPDFRAGERTFALIMQVCGRSGRARPGEAIVQTYSPTHPAIEFAARADYDGFARAELAERRATRYPPFASLVYLGIVSRSPRTCPRQWVP